jgi:DNA-binding Lrp family transcriptional regulator
MKPRDVAIINNLRRDSRASMTEMANATGIPLSTVFKSVESMQKERVIYRYVSLIDFAEAGYPFRMALLIKAEDKGKACKYLESHPSLNTLLKISDDYDYYAEFILKDLSALQDLLDEIEKLGIAGKKSVHYLQEISREEFMAQEVRSHGKRKAKV